MKQYTNHTNLKKHIILLGGIAILLNSSMPMQASIIDSFKTAGSSILQRIKGLNKAAIFDQLLTQIGKLGTQIADIRDCMFYGHDCTPAKRAAFYGTAITILALTAAVVGFTITIAATSQEPDQDLNNAVKTTSQEIKGWGAQQIMQRLRMQADAFKQNLTEMKECLISRKCTKGQKRALYATAATIVTLVVAAIAVSVGSYAYAQKKRQREMAGLPGEQPTGTPGTPGYRPSFTFDEAPYPEKKESRFGQLFKRTIGITQAGKTFFQETYQAIKEKVSRGLIATKEAAAETFLDLVEKGQKFWQLIERVFDVSLERLKGAIETTKTKFETLATNIKAAKHIVFMTQFRDLMKYLGGIIHTVKIINPLEKPDGYEGAKKRVARIKGQSIEYLQDMLRVREQEFKKGKIKREQVQSVKDDIRIKEFIKISNLNSIYPNVVAKLNALHLKEFGIVAETITKGLKALIEAALWIHKQAGKIGLLVSQSNAQQKLEELAKRIQTLGQDIKETTNVDKILATDIAVSTIDIILGTGEEGEEKAISSFGILAKLVNAARSKEFKYLRKTGSATIARSTLRQADKLTDEIELALRHFLRDIQSIGSNTKEQFVTTIKKNPLKGIPNAATILRDALQKSVDQARETFNNLLKICTTLIKTIEAGAPDLYKTLEAINGYMFSVRGTNFINPQFLHGLKKTIEHLKNTGTTAEQLSKALDVVPVAAAAA